MAKIDFSDENCGSLFDLDPITKGKGGGFVIQKYDENTTEQPPKKKRGRPRKNKDENNSDVAIIESVPMSVDIPMCQSNVPYINTYDETNDMLKNAICEIDYMNINVAKDLESIRASKTLKNKYNHIADLTGISSSLINTKITAIRELNKSKTDSHNLELKRMKDIASSKAILSETDDNKYIMDLYNAFIQTPTGNIPQGFMPNQMNFQSDYSDSIIVGDMNMNQNIGLSPIENRMRLEATNPNIKVVLVYNQTTGEKFFDAMDMVTGEKINNYPLPSNMFLADTVPYVNEGIARNVNLDQTYPLIVINDNNINIY